MSTKSTILLTSCCHIYKDKQYQHTNLPCDEDKETLVIDVSYGDIQDTYEYLNCIAVEWDSDFAAMIRFMIKTCGADVIEKFVSTYHKNQAALGE
ncbi:MAG: hypothetical protein ACPG5L_08115 [Vibrio gallaecicus]